MKITRIERKDIRDLRTLAQALAYELSELSRDISEKLTYSNTETIDIIDFVDAALECMKNDMCKFYGKQLNRFSNEFYRYESIA